MSKSIQDLRDARNTKAKALTELAAKVDFAAADQTAYDTLHGEIGAIDESIERINKANALAAGGALHDQAVDRAQKVAVDNKSDGARAFAAFLKNTERALSPDDMALILNTMSTTTQTEGGYLVPTEIAPKLLVAMKKYGAMRDVATTIPTLTGGSLQFPTADPTAEEGEIVPENASTSAVDTSFGTMALPVYKYSSKSVAVPLELLQDSVVDIEAYVLGLLAMRLGRVTNRHFTKGTGISQPNGIITAAPVGVTAANGSSQVTAIVADTLFDIYHKVDPAYRELNNTGWMMNDNSLKIVRKLKDGQNRYMFAPGYEIGPAGGVPDQLLGRPITVNQQMDDMAAGAISMLFGDFSFYTIRDVMSILVRRFDDSPFAMKGQAGFCAWLRSGGNLIDVGGAVKAFKNAAS